MKPNFTHRPQGFTLLETVIAIGVLAVLLTGFMVVFAPAADGIRKSINVQQADRFASALEEELVTLRTTSDQTNFKTGFGKSFDWLKDSSTAGNALVAYQYRGKINSLRTDDKTPLPEPNAKTNMPGKDYVVIPMVRRKSDAKFAEDLKAIEGAVYLVKCTQLVFTNGELKSGKPGEITNPSPIPASATNTKPGPYSNSDDYPEAVIAFAAEFHIMPSKDPAYYSGSAFTKKFGDVKNPVFTRNLAVRR